LLNKIKPQGKKNQKFNLNLYALRASLIQINFKKKNRNLSSHTFTDILTELLVKFFSNTTF